MTSNEYYPIHRLFFPFTREKSTRDHNDNRPENLVVLCRDCHINVTHGYYAAEFPSDMDEIVDEETNGIIEEA